MQQHLSEPIVAADDASRPVPLADLPAAAACAVATGAGVYGLSYHLAFDDYRSTVFGLLAVSITLVLGTLVGSAAVAAICRLLRLLLLIGMPLWLFLSFDSLVPADARGEATTMTAVFMGWVMLYTVLLVGMRVEGRVLGWSTPLVPALSLFGLLNLVSVDTPIQVSFVVFVVASIYLITYEGILRAAQQEAIQRTLPSDLDRPFQRIAAYFSPLSVQPGAARADASAAQGAPPRESNAVLRIAAQIGVAATVWVCCFLLGGAVLYYPLQASLARFGFSPMFGARATQAVQDWRASSPVMELHGGHYPLSDREMLRVSYRGAAPQLWRSRLYTEYTGSRWQESTDSSILRIRTRPGQFTDLHRHLALLPPSLGNWQNIMQHVEPLAMGTSRLYSCGEPVAAGGSWTRLAVAGDGTVTATSLVRYRAPYNVLARIPRFRQKALEQQPGLTARELAAWRNDPAYAGTLDLPDNPDDQTLRLLRHQILASAAAARRPLRTPCQKVEAVEAFLYNTCVYSLQSPAVPDTEDAVSFFLNHSHQGACDMFASAAALLLRSMDVPTRIATGYAQPDTLAGPAAMQPDSGFDGTAVLHEREAHAWIEYYLPSIGWIDADPTANTRLAPDQSSGFNWLLKLRTLLAHTPMMMVPLAGLMLLLAGAAWSMAEKRKHTVHSPQQLRALDQIRVQDAYRQALRMMERRTPRSPHDTPLEYASVVDASALPPDVKQEFGDLTQLLVSAFYRPAMDSGGPPPELLAGLLRRLRRQLK